MKGKKIVCPNCGSSNCTENLCMSCQLKAPQCEMCNTSITFLEYVGTSGHSSGLVYILFRCSFCKYVNQVEQPNWHIKCPICQAFIIDKKSCYSCENNVPSCHICRHSLSFLDYVEKHGKQNSPYAYHYFRCPECTTLIDMRER